MRTIEEIKGLLNIELENKCGRNYIYKVYLHDSRKPMTKKTRKSVIYCNMSFKHEQELTNENYGTSSRTETFLMEILDCRMNDNYEQELNAEKIENYRRFLLKQISFEELKNKILNTVTH